MFLLYLKKIFLDKRSFYVLYCVYSFFKSFDKYGVWLMIIFVRDDCFIICCKVFIGSMDVIYSSINVNK